jgi:hypothetical protein
MENQEAYQGAKRRVEIKLGFYGHLGMYLAVNALLVIINLVTSTEYFWFKWPLLGWGIGVIFHGLGVFIFSSGTLAAVKERMIAEAMKNAKSRRISISTERTRP